MNSINFIGAGHINKVFPELFGQDGKYLLVDEPPNTAAALARIGIADDRPSNDLANATAYLFVLPLLQAFDKVLEYFEEVAGDAAGPSPKMKAAIQAAVGAEDQVKQLTHNAFAHAFVPACVTGLESRAHTSGFRKALGGILLRLDANGWVQCHCAYCHQNVDVLSNAERFIGGRIVLQFFGDHLKNCSLCPADVKEDWGWSVDDGGKVKGQNHYRRSQTYVQHKAAKANLEARKVDDGKTITVGGVSYPAMRLQFNKDGVETAVKESKYKALLVNADKLFNDYQLKAFGYDELVKVNLDDIFGYKESLIVTSDVQLSADVEMDSMKEFVASLRDKKGG